MKSRSSCLACRRRHRRCVTRPGATRCNGCEELDKDCEFSPRFLFRPSKQSSAGEAKNKTPESQPGVQGSQDTSQQSVCKHGIVLLIVESSLNYADLPAADVVSRTSSTNEPQRSVVGTLDTPNNPWDGAYPSILEDTSPRLSSGTSPGLRDLAPTSSSYADSRGSPQRSQWWSTTLIPSNPGDPPALTGQNSTSVAFDSSQTQSLPQLSRREAILFRMWIQKISLVASPEVPTWLTTRSNAVAVRCRG